MDHIKDAQEQENLRVQAASSATCASALQHFKRNSGGRCYGRPRP
jgi:hypothetical protein